MKDQVKKSGTCFHCNREFSGRGMLRHLKSCKARAEAMRQEAESPLAEEIHHIRVTEPHGKYCWLDLEMPASATLLDLDRYLRHIWLECCDHLSDYMLRNIRVLCPRDGNIETRNVIIPINRKIGEALSFDHPLIYTYDYGTETELEIKGVGSRSGLRGEYVKIPVRLISRNRPYPEFKNYEEEPVWNSPRWGICGYDGPAEEPKGDYSQDTYECEEMRLRPHPLFGGPEDEERRYGEFLRDIGRTA